MKKIAVFASVFLLAAAAHARVPMGGLIEGIEPGPDGMIDVLTVFAHQDDETIPGGGTLIKLSKDPRVRIHIACLTLGDMSEAKDFLKITPEHLGQIRSRELETAASVLGAVEVIQLDYHDQGLEGADQEELVRKVREIIASTGAEVVVTHEPAGVTRHPDHVTCSRVATEAFSRTGAKRLYYVTLPRSLYASRYLITPFKAEAKPVFPTLKVDIKRELKLKRMAMCAHATQRHFSLVGMVMVEIGMINREWFALAAENE